MASLIRVFLAGLLLVGFVVAAPVDERHHSANERTEEEPASVLRGEHDETASEEPPPEEQDQEEQVPETPGVFDRGFLAARRQDEPAHEQTPEDPVRDFVPFFQRDEPTHEPAPEEPVYHDEASSLTSTFDDSVGHGDLEVSPQHHQPAGQEEETQLSVHEETGQEDYNQETYHDEVPSESQQSFRQDYPHQDSAPVSQTDSVNQDSHDSHDFLPLFPDPEPDYEEDPVSSSAGSYGHR